MSRITVSESEDVSLYILPAKKEGSAVITCTRQAGDYIEMAYLFENNTTEVASDHYYQE